MARSTGGRQRRYSACHSGSAAAWSRVALSRSYWAWTLKTRPVLERVQRSLSGQVAHSFLNWAWREPFAEGRPSATVCPAGQVAWPCSVSMVKSSAVNPLGIAGLSGGGFRTRLCPCPWRCSRKSGAVGGVAQGGDRRVLLGEEILGDGGLVVVRAAARGQGDVGEHPGLGFEGHVGAEALLVTGPVLVDVPRLGVDGGHRAVADRALGDAPASVAAVGVVSGFHVLARDQGQQPERVRRGLARLLLGQPAQQGERVGDQGVDQVGAGGLVVPGDLRLAGVGVVVGGAPGRGGLLGVGDLADDPADRGDQLGDGVLGGDRVVQHGGVQRPPLPALEDTGRRHDLPDLVEQPVRVAGTLQAAEVGQQRGVERGVVQPEPARRLPPQVAPQFLHRLEVRQAVQALHTTVAARTCGGIEGRPLVEGYMSANIDFGNSISRCSARNANTPPAGISSRQVSHTSSPTLSPPHSPCMTQDWPHSTRSRVRTHNFQERSRSPAPTRTRTGRGPPRCPPVRSRRVVRPPQRHPRVLSSRQPAAR